MDVIDLFVDVSDTVDLGEPAKVAATVHLPDPAEVGPQPIVCFAKPGGAYSKGYFTENLPGPGSGSQAQWHSSRGWIFVSIDHLGSGSSTVPRNLLKLDYTTVAAGNHAAEQNILARLLTGSVRSGFPSISDPVLLGIGQSMGGCMSVIQQGRYHCYDGIAVLGFSAIHTHPPVPPGSNVIVAPWIPRDAMRLDPFITTNGAALAAADLLAGSPETGPAMEWGFFYDDVDPDIRHRDLQNFPAGTENLPRWRSSTLPLPVALETLTPGAIAPEAAAVTSPVLVAMGERDVVADPKGEPRAYLSARSVDLFICPKMGHMHNFAGTRQLLWHRIETWAAWVCHVKSSK